MSQRLPWLRIFAEGVAIVVSILLAFGIQAWWDERQERGEEALLLGSLLDEFRTDRPPLIERASQHERLASSAAELLQILTTSQAPEVQVADTLLLSLGVTPTYEPRIGTLDEAQSSGRLRLVRNRELRALLAEWPGRLADALEEQETAYHLWLNRSFQVYASSILVADLMGPVNIRFLAGEPQEDPHASRTIPVTPGLANYTGSRRRALSRSASELATIRNQLDSIVQLLESELAR